MATVKIPIITSSFYKTSDTSKIKSKLSSIYSNFKSYIDNVSSYNKMPKEFLISVIFIESQGKKDVVAGNAVGLMQVDPNSCTDLVTMERKDKELTVQEKNIISKYIDKTRYNKILKATMGQSFFTQKDLLNPELNMCMGAMLLARLIREESKTGVVRLDRIIARYNQGYYSNRSNKTLDVKTFTNNLKGTTKDYVLKFAGLNGTLDILV